MALNYGKRFSFPENAEIKFDNVVHSVTQKVIAQFVDDYDDYIVSQIANTARENGISELVVLNKTTIMDALNKQIPKKPKLMENPLINSKYWFYCPNCNASRHTDIKVKHCSFCGQALDWSDTE